MFISSCLHPVKIRNRKTGLSELVPCGKCEACVNARSSNWVRRITDESKCWKYCYFVTLTYDDRSVPFVSLSHDCEPPCVFNHTTGELVDCSSLSRSDILRIKKAGKIRVLSRIDLQNFFKRLRYYFKENEKKFGVKKASSLLRYYAIGEYGSTTKRPHYHFILWFSSDLQATKIEESLHKAWTYGIIDYSPVRSSAASYCAQYLNCTAHLPEVLKLPSFKPFALFSKCPAIGSLSYTDEEILKIFYLSSPVMRIQRNNEFEYVHLQPSLANKLFPTFKGFNDFSHTDRVTLFGLASYSGAEDWNTFKEWYFGQLSYYWETVGSLPWLLRVLDENFTDKTPFDKYGWSRNSDDMLRALRQLFYASSRVITQCNIFRVSIDFYVSKIEDYAYHVNQLNLRTMYEFEQEYLKYNSLQSLVAIDSTFLLRLATYYDNAFDSPIPSHVEMQLSTFGLDSSIFYDVAARERLSLEFNQNFQQFRDLNFQISTSNIKTKVKNDYLAAHPELTLL